MRILELISSAGNYGAENVMVTLSKSLGEMGHRVTAGVFENLHTPNLDVARMAEAKGVEVRLFRCAGRFDRKAALAIRAFIQAEGVEIVHSHGYKSNLYAYWAARGTKAKTVSSCHGWFDERFPTNLYGALDRRLLKRFDRVVAISEPIRQQLLRSGVAAEKIELIENGIDFSPFQAAAPTFRTQRGLQQRPVIGLVGRLATQKGHECLLRAAAELCARFPQAVYAFFGTGPLEEALKQLAHELKLEEQVVFAGHSKDMPGVYASLDVLAMPSLDEGLPIALLEAMASARAVVATPVGEIPTVLRSEENGLLTPVGDASALSAALARLLNDDALRRRLGEAARATVQQRFGAERMAGLYVKAFETSLAPGSRA